MEKTTAILINRYRLTESSLIIVWCSEEAGIFKTVAKGALQPKSAFAGRLDLLVKCEVVWTLARSPSSDLHTLKEVQLLEPYKGLRASYSRVLAATYFCKLIEMVTETGTPLHGVYSLLEMSLEYLNTHDPSLKLVLRFEDRLCTDLGLGDASVGMGARLISDTFHRPLPAQRASLLAELQKSAR